MSKYKDMAMAKASDLKGGMSNIKGGVKGKVNGVLGRKSSTDPSAAAADHVARPISTLRDPDSFAPPPRRTTSGLSEPPPRETAPRRVVMAPSKYQDPRGPRVDPPPKISSSRQLLEAPPPEDNEGGEYEHEQPAPYRMNTTGLSTSHLPPPPTRRDGTNEKSPPSYDSPMSARRVPPQSQNTAPSLPPRLPPRTNSGTSSDGVISALPHQGNLNQGAVSRLGAAGISVPGFGIGSSEDPAPPKPPRPVASQPNLLQSRMFKTAASAASSSPFSSSAENVAAHQQQQQQQQQQSPSEGTTWAQKQAAFKTASAFHKDPGSVSFADAKAAASTANNFRQRHGHQVAAGLSAASDINQKYGVAERIGALSSQHSAGGGGGHSPSSSTASLTAGASAMSALAGKKKPPPPPPPAKKKPSLGGPLHNGGGGGGGGGGGAPHAGDDAPPPIPFATRPTF